VITTDTPPFAIGDVVRVRVAARRDVSFVVREITDDGRVCAGDDRSEVIYPASAFERVRDADPDTLEDGKGVTVPTLRPWGRLEPVTSPPTAPRSWSSVPAFDTAKFNDGLTVRARPGEPVESLLLRFKKAVARANALSEHRDSLRYIPKPEARRLKSARARARREKSARAFEKFHTHRESL